MAAVIDFLGRVFAPAQKTYSVHDKKIAIGLLGMQPELCVMEVCPLMDLGLDEEAAVRIASMRYTAYVKQIKFRDDPGNIYRDSLHVAGLRNIAKAIREEAQDLLEYEEMEEAERTDRDRRVRATRSSTKTDESVDSELKSRLNVLWC